MADLTIGRFAAAGGVGVETVRYYQRRGLLETPERDIGGGDTRIRRYGREALRRLRFIRSAQAAGFSLDQIGELLALDAGQAELARQAADRLVQAHPTLPGLRAFRYAVEERARSVALDGASEP